MGSADERDLAKALENAADHIELVEGYTGMELTKNNFAEFRKSWCDYMKKSSCAKGSVIGFASEALMVVVQQNKLLKKMDTVVSEIEGRYKSRIIELQQQLLEKKDAEIASLKTVAASVEKNLKSYSEAMSSTPSVQPTQPQFTPSSLKRVFRDAVQEKEASANLMVFGLSEEGGEDLDNKVVEIFDKLEEKPRIVDSFRLGKPCDTDRPVKVVLASPEAAASLIRRSYKLRDCERFRKVYVAPDRPKEERIRRKQLVDKLKEKRKAEPTGKFTIRNDEVVRDDGVKT